MLITDSLMRRIVQAAAKLEQPTLRAIAVAADVPEYVAYKALRAAERLGLLNRSDHLSSQGR
jgi:hypothetical protein